MRIKSIPRSQTYTAQAAAFSLMVSFLPFLVQAQTADGNNGINQANTLVRGYYDTATQLMYALGAIVGLIGAFRVFTAMTSSENHNAGRLAAGWFGACIFLVVVAAVIRSFFGL